MAPCAPGFAYDQGTIISDRNIEGLGAHGFVGENNYVPVPQLLILRGGGGWQRLAYLEGKQQRACQFQTSRHNKTKYIPTTSFSQYLSTPSCLSQLYQAGRSHNQACRRGPRSETSPAEPNIWNPGPARRRSVCRGTRNPKHLRGQWIISGVKRYIWFYLSFNLIF